MPHVKLVERYLNFFRYLFILVFLFAIFLVVISVVAVSTYKICVLKQLNKASSVYYEAGILLH